jgi:elongation factor P
MAALIDAIDVKRKMFFELDGTPFHCLDVEVNTPCCPWRTDSGPPEDA